MNHEKLKDLLEDDAWRDPPPAKPTSQMEHHNQNPSPPYVNCLRGEQLVCTHAPCQQAAQSATESNLRAQEVPSLPVLTDRDVRAGEIVLSAQGKALGVAMEGARKGQVVQVALSSRGILRKDTEKKNPPL